MADSLGLLAGHYYDKWIPVDVALSGNATWREGDKQYLKLRIFAVYASEPDLTDPSSTSAHVFPCLYCLAHHRCRSDRRKSCNLYRSNSRSTNAADTAAIASSHRISATHTLLLAIPAALRSQVSLSCWLTSYR